MKWRIRLKFEPRDIWVGLFWDRAYDGLHLYVCLLPMIVVHISRVRACRVCGCTDDRACTDEVLLFGHPSPGCWWVEPNLSSACAFGGGS